MVVYVVMQSAINNKVGGAEVVVDIVEVTNSEARARELCERLENTWYSIRFVKDKDGKEVIR